MYRERIVLEPVKINITEDSAVCQHKNVGKYFK